MLPPEISEATLSAAERKLFATIRDDLSDEWTALHSVGLICHERKPWAEIDYVLIGPSGLFCLEVKGGRVSRQDGRWLFTDRNDRVTEKSQGPFEQVGTACAALTHHLSDQFPKIWDIVVGYGVVTPDIIFEIRGPDIESRIVRDARDEPENFMCYLTRLQQYWSERLSAQRARPIRGLESEERHRLVSLLRGDFDLRPSLATRVGLVNDELLRLTQEQYHVLDGLAENERVIIRGGAGTGKTFLAVEEARRHAAAGRRVALFCFNKRLAVFIAKAVDDQNLIRVRHLHGFMADMLARSGLSERLPRGHPDDLFTVIYPKLCTEALMEEAAGHEYDVLILDEAQDLLRETYVDVLDLLLKDGLSRGMWRAFLDPKQNIFSGVHPRGMQRLVDSRPAQYRLTTNCRNTAPIAVNTALLSGIVPDETLVVAGPQVEICWYQDNPTQVREVSKHVNRLLSGGIKPNDIILLSTRRLRNSAFADGLRAVPYPLRELDDNILEAAGWIRYSTIGAFKGLESDAVVIVDVNELTSEESRSALYVAASRAKVLLSVYINETARRDYDNRAEEFGRILAQVR